MKTISFNNPEQTYTSVQICQKRQQFYTQIKQRSKQSIMRAIRCQYFKQQRNKILNDLIQRTQTQIQSQQLANLLYYAQLGMKNAVIHIGNLFLQFILDERVFQEFGTNWLLEIDANCGYYEWLLHILVCRKFIDSSYKVYQRAIKALITSKTQNEIRILNLIKCLNTIGKTYQNSFINCLILPIFQKYQMQELLKHCCSKSYDISKQSWRMASILFSNEEQWLAHQMIKSYGLKNMLQLIKLGLMSVFSHIRSIACQILTNNLSILMEQSKISSQNNEMQQKLKYIRQICFNLALSPCQKYQVKLEISFYIINCIQICPPQELRQCFHNGLSQVIEQLTLFNANQKHFALQLQNNCKFIYQQLRNIFNEKLQNYGRITQIYTMQEQY